MKKKCGAMTWNTMPKSIRIRLLAKMQERLGVDPEISYREIRDKAKFMSEAQWSELDPDLKRVFCRFTRQNRF
jgi:hypothetical protein